ncbi:MAG: LysR family transcriptional regulator [Pseudomonadota bacterium]|jgi:DNA-binding transcriptional LysR family regulator|uniref:LysR family transcriptional regulator n=1 Tax=Burkholderiaceae TaxID=119060 RepID=UPI0010F5971C|nr:LysR family transcriptional regulator [Burkholderia sp. 4M9327F10]
MDYFAAVRAFLCAADLQSFSKTAQQMELKTSTVSRYVTELEGDLGIALFNRSTRGLVLTEGGRVFREHALVAMNAMDEARSVTSSLNASPQGVLRVTMPTSFGRKHVVTHLPEFLQKHPRIGVDMIFSDEVINLIESEVDLAIRIGVLPDSQLMARRLAAHRRIVCASPAYVAAHGAPETPEELSRHTALRFSRAVDDKWILSRRKAKSKAKDVTVQLSGQVRANDTDAIIDLAVAGCGIALLPEWSIGAELRAGTLMALLVDWEARPTRLDPAIWAVYPPKKVVSSKVRAFVDFYAKIFGSDDYWVHP